jgi:hypothetical protein
MLRTAVPSAHRRSSAHQGPVNDAIECQMSAKLRCGCVAGCTVVHIAAGDVSIRAVRMRRLSLKETALQPAAARPQLVAPDIVRLLGTWRSAAAWSACQEDGVH